MAASTAVANIFIGLLSNFFILFMGLLVVVACIPAYLFMFKYNINVEIHEQHGKGVRRWYTKAAIVNNKKRGRKELHILKTKGGAVNSLIPFSKNNNYYWGYTPLPNDYDHITKKGKKIYCFFKVGDLPTDLTPIKPLNVVNANIQPTDVSILDWYAQGLEKDARETRHEPDKMSKLMAIGVPVLTYGLLFIAMILTYDYGRDTQAVQQSVAASLEQSSKNIQSIANVQAGIQEIPSEAREPEVANQLLESVGVGLG